MFVIHGTSHPLYDNSAVWIVGAYDDESCARKLIAQLSDALPSVSELLKRVPHMTLYDDEISKLKSIHPRSLPMDTTFGFRDYRIEYGLSDLNDVCVASLW
jgi:hypothetical protein